ncbi:MAG: EamA family transporter, partial [Acetobacteraceae bacterium]
MTPASQPADNTRATVLMVGSMAFFAVEDLFLKRSAEALPPGQVLALTGAAGACVFWALAARQRQPILSLEALRGMALVRTLAEAAAAMLYIVALALAPLTMTSALLQASPLVVVAGAALFLGEKVGWRRWASILVGFAGVLVILEPWDAAFDPTGLLTVACVVMLAARWHYWRQEVWVAGLRCVVRGSVRVVELAVGVVVRDVRLYVARRGGVARR